MRVGLPRGLLYYNYYPFWIKFFEELGAEVVISDKTNKNILDDGVMYSINDACLPIKLYIGHVINLKDKVDFVFVPRIISIEEKEFICPKFCGLPNMIRHSDLQLPQLIDTTVDFRKSKKNLFRTIKTIGNHITKDTNKIRKAFKKSIDVYIDYNNKIKNEVLPIDIGRINLCEKTHNEKIVVLGHPYIIYDSYMSMDIINKLRKYNVGVLTPESFDESLINEKAKIMDKKIFWSFGRKIIGAALYAMEQEDINAIVYVTAFGCGLDSVIADILERRIRRNSDKPFVLLTLDEHTGEAGINTRLEAFMDMIRWRRKNENNFSTHG